MDLDRFKEINDSLGHGAGDTALQEIGRRLSDIAREAGYFVGRLGGDEFGLIVHGQNGQDDVLRAADQLLGVLSRPIEIEGRSYAMSASVGISIFPYDGEDETVLLSKADSAMYEGKRQGGNTVRVAATVQNSL